MSSCLTHAYPCWSNIEHNRHDYCSINKSFCLCVFQLTILFNDSQTSNNYFLGAKVVRLLPGSMQATYEVLYQNSANVNANYVEAVFRTVAVSISFFIFYKGIENCTLF